MSKTFDIVLDGTTYAVKPMNLGQLRQLAKMTRTMDTADVGFELFGMMLKTAEPPVEDWEALTPTPEELDRAMRQIMEAAGLSKGEAQARAAEAAT